MDHANPMELIVQVTEIVFRSLKEALVSHLFQILVLQLLAAIHVVHAVVMSIELVRVQM
jgi:hypothetical protein